MSALSFAALAQLSGDGGQLSVSRQRSPWKEKQIRRQPRCCSTPGKSVRLPAVVSIERHQVRRRLQIWMVWTQEPLEWERPSWRIHWPSIGVAVPIGLCQNCQAVDSTNPPAATCSVCGATPQQNPAYKVVNLSQPTGFRTLWNASRDFDGVFEWVPRASRPKTGAIQRPVINQRNFGVWSGQDTVYVINDNNGACFDFVKLARGETWVTQAAVDQVRAMTGAPAQNYAPVPADTRALASIKQTDIFIVGITRWPQGVYADPRNVYGRAALYSFGFMLRRAAAVRLDVDERELRVGLRVLNNSGTVTGQIFLSDSLENGAGYSSVLGRPRELEALLEFILGGGAPPDPRFNAPMLAVAHAGQCQSSCPDCLRDFSNLAFHNILDWRLALDLARLALDANAAIDFTASYWQPAADDITRAYCLGQPQGWTFQHQAGLPSAVGPRHVELVTHPLWLSDAPLHPGLDAAIQHVQAATGASPTSKPVFDVLRRPY